MSIRTKRIPCAANGVEIFEIAYDRNDEITILIDDYISNFVVSSEDFLDTHGYFPFPTSSSTSLMFHVMNVEDYPTGLALLRQYPVKKEVPLLIKDYEDIAFFAFR